MYTKKKKDANLNSKWTYRFPFLKLKIKNETYLLFKLTTGMRLIPFKVTPTETIGNSIDLESTDKNNNGAASSNAEISEFREITLGRGQLTGILDNRLSRKQISMRYSLKSKQVFVKRIGINSSCIAKPNNEGLSQS